jgi:hypothetical protein
MTEQDEAPFVCPGCHAVGDEPCAPGYCIDNYRRLRDEWVVEWAGDDAGGDRTPQDPTRGEER